MNIEIINTGSELMLGRVLNTHQQWLCRQLTDRGYLVQRQVSIADEGKAIQDAVREAAGHADLIICTGGLGPTSDDLTRDLIAELLGKPLHEDPRIAAQIESFFTKRKRPMPPSTLIQARVPEGALVLENRYGTAPGLAMKLDPNPYRPDRKATWIVMLPGPPRELRPVFLEEVVPFLNREFPLEAVFACRTLRSVGLGESRVEEQIAPALAQLTKAGLQIGYCARVGEVDVRLVFEGCGAEETVQEAAEIVYGQIGNHIFAENDENMENTLVKMLTERKKTLALAESCTGGFIAHRLTNVSGASAVLLAGLVTYSNEAKQQFLGVPAETLAAHGAVSEATARAMVEGVRAKTGADYAIAVTGIAGPTGGTPEKPVGTVFIALTDGERTKVINPINAFDRETFKYITSQQALEMLRRRLLSLDA
ncbi:MAG TPA: competence/damage-inducible protein A [Verrucomicrobiae bacterium]